MCMEEEGLTTAAVARLIGATYRQVDYWCRMGKIAGQAGGPGSGCRRQWSLEQLDIARELKRRSDIRRAPLAA